jgi:PTS system glucose-specific IIA component
MGLFNRHRKFTLGAPVQGRLVPLKSVKHAVYASNQYGVGFAVEPDCDQVVSPIAGMIVSYFPTKHAVGIRADKLEVLVHMGIDTVELNGNPFETLVKVGDHVDVNTPLSRMDLAQIYQAGKAATTMVVVVNAGEHVKALHVPDSGVVTAGETVGQVVEV